MKKIISFSFALFFGCIVNAQKLSEQNKLDNLVFQKLPDRWDEALPLGNAMLGALIWQKGDHLRFSLDRADLWDERPALDLSKLNFQWVREQVLKKQYDTVQSLGDAPYEASAFPTKIPVAALEFNTAALGKVKMAMMDIHTATAKIFWENGSILETFVDATSPFGAFRIIHAPVGILPKIMTAPYHTEQKSGGNNSVAGQALSNLGYREGQLQTDAHHSTYIQPGANGFSYEVSVCWKYNKDTLEGVWSIASYKHAVKPMHVAESICKQKLTFGYQKLLPAHILWWDKFWKQSSVNLPDTILQRQYDLELYKLGAVARRGAPPITLQAIWTADNGSLPPWKGDIHNDLNTQLSYWPAYSGNHLQEAASFTDWLWKVKKTNEDYTKEYFQVNGLNVPGVATLSGYPMGGWIQYSMSPTISSWLAQNFYWQWKYSMNNDFLRNRAYPYLHEVAVFLSNITKVDNGIRQLPLSSSPEIHDNDISAWYTKGNTNYDVALMRFAYGAASEAAMAMGKGQEAAKWKKQMAELPGFAIDHTGLMIAPGEDRIASHRHHSNLMAIYPLGLLNPERPADKAIIDSSLRWMEHTGTREWCGYSFSWAASLYARAKEGAGAVHQLRIFASNFCSPNSFHLNGDQKGGQYSGFTYRPFTLEGNFAFAQGVQEMLLQSYSGLIEVFPAVPKDWKNVSFRDLRAEGAFLISASREQGQVAMLRVQAEQGGKARILLPFKTWFAPSDSGVVSKKYQDGILEVVFKKGGWILLKNGYE